MSQEHRYGEKGDTLVEMIFAFAILSLVVVGVLAIMNRGIRISQESIERTLVRQQMDGQAEVVRYLHDTNSGTWATIKQRVTDQIMPLSPKLADGQSQLACPTLSSGLADSAKKAFYLSHSGNTFTVSDLNGSTYQDAATYAKVPMNKSKSEGIWLQVAKAQNDLATKDKQAAEKVAAYDVYVHACWYGPGESTPTTLGTIVRLYDQS